MRLFTKTLLVLAVAAAPAVLRADDPAAYKELLDKAAKAQGGADKAAKLIDVTLKGKATITEGGKTGELGFDVSMKGLDRMRGEMTMMRDGQTNRATIVIADGKGWARDADRDKTEEAPPEALAGIQSVLLALRAPGMPAGLAGQKELTLAHGGEGKVDDTPVELLRISRKEQPDVTVYFDKKTSLPLKCETQIKEGPGGPEKNIELRFSDFKEFDGVKHYTKAKLTFDGKETGELELTEVKPGAKFEASTFDKP